MFARTLQAVVGFLIVSLAAAVIGQHSARAGFPMIAGYLVCGVLVGPFVLNLVREEHLGELEFVNQVALATVAFCAGSELYFPDLKALYRPIVAYLSAIVAGTMLFVSLAIVAISSNVSWIKHTNATCQAQIPLLYSVLMVARSPASAIALISEYRLAGSFTKTVLGITVVSDIALLILYAVVSSITMSACSSTAFSSVLFAGILLSVGLSCALGCALGALLLVYLWVPRIHSQLRGVLILYTGYLVFRYSRTIATGLSVHSGMTLSLEPLLLCLVASCIAGNKSHNRRKFANILHKASPFIFLPFFTMTGASLDLAALKTGIVIAVILVVVRAAALALATIAVGHSRGEVSYTMWMTLLPQAGTALGLANEIKQLNTEWAAMLASTVVATVIINNILGLQLSKYAFQRSADAGKLDVQERIRKGAVSVVGFSHVKRHSSRLGLGGMIAARMSARGFHTVLIPPSHATDREASRVFGETMQLATEMCSLVHPHSDTKPRLMLGSDCTSRSAFLHTSQAVIVVMALNETLTMLRSLKEANMYPKKVIVILEDYNDAHHLESAHLDAIVLSPLGSILGDLDQVLLALRAGERVTNLDYVAAEHAHVHLRIAEEETPLYSLDSPRVQHIESQSGAFDRVGSHLHTLGLADPHPIESKPLLGRTPPLRLAHFGAVAQQHALDEPLLSTYSVTESSDEEITIEDQ